jgi:hypothetical protein
VPQPERTQWASNVNVRPSFVFSLKLIRSAEPSSGMRSGISPLKDIESVRSSADPATPASAISR